MMFFNIVIFFCVCTVVCIPIVFAQKRTIAKEARFNVFPATSKENRRDMGNHGGSQGRFFHLYFYHYPFTLPRATPCTMCLDNIR